MRQLATIAILISALSTPALATSVETADGDWSQLPQLAQRGYHHLSEKMQAKLYEIAASHQCPSFELSQGWLNLKLTFAAQYSPSGTLDRIILPKLGCPSAESVLGGTLVEMFKGGDYASTGKNEDGWYQGGLAFRFAGPNALDPGVAKAASKMTSEVGHDPNEIVCEQVEKIGTRLGAERTCMSRAQWAEQKRRNRETLDEAQQTRCNSADPPNLSC